MIKDAVEDTALKTAGGVITYGSSYAIVHTALTVKDVSEIATLVATCITALYFLAQFLYTLWKWHKDVKQAKENKRVHLHSKR